MNIVNWRGLAPAQLYASEVVLFIIAALFLYFIGWFVVPGILTFASLRKTRRLIEKSSTQSGFSAAALERLNESFRKSRARASWQSYSKTLVQDKHADDDGVAHVASWHTSTPADTFFTASALIEVPLGTEFFKHLPGILTGLGIIGTFVGIITGLLQPGSDFKPGQQEATLLFLQHLMQAVGSAFVVSAIAISAATLVTLVEKLQLAAAVGELSRLINLLDRLFNKDLTDTHLERLVAASERSATQMAQLKDSLITDLKELLDELAVRNAQSLDKQTESLSRNLAESIKASFDEPIGRITEAVNNISSSQGDTVSRLLTDMIARFTDRFEDIVGKQNSEMTRMLAESASHIRGVASDFSQLAASLKDAGRDAAAAMGDEISKVLQGISTQQQASANMLETFMREFHSTIADSQQDSRDKQETLIGQLSSSVSEMMSRMQAASQSLAAEQRQQQVEFGDKVGQITGSLSDALETLIQQNTAAISSLQENVRALTEVTVKAITGIENGANKLQDATLGLAVAGDNLTASLGAASGLASEIGASATQISAASGLLEGSIRASHGLTGTFSQIVADLKSTVESAKREAGVTSELVASIESAAKKFEEAGHSTEQYLEQVSEVLGATHREFANSVENTLKSMSKRFHEDLSQAVGLLSGSINDLRVYLDELGDAMSPSSK
jgi:DNA anti-recombination protein RmuC